MTVDGTTHALEPPFLVLATQNPIEYEGTYPLPEAQLDRFLLRTGVRLPGRGRRVGDARAPPRAPRRTRSSSDAVVDRDDAARDAARDRGRPRRRERRPLRRSPSSRATRESASVAVGSSPRGSLALLKLSRCRAALAGRDFVTPDDVKSVAVPALAHRLVLRPELWVQRRTGADVVQEVLDAGPRRRPRRRRTRVTRQRDAAPGGVRRAWRRPALVAALALRRPELAVARGAVRRARRARRPRRDRLAPTSARRSTASARSRATCRRRRSTVRAEAAVDRLEIGLALPDAARGRRGPRARGAPPGARTRSASSTLRLRCARWGSSQSATSGSARATGSASSAARGGSTAVGRCGSTRTPERSRRLVAPAHTQAAIGNRGRAGPRRGPRVRGHAAVRPGDRVRSVNWRASARRGALVVNERHPERNADVVLFLDSFAEARRADDGDARAGGARGGDARRRCTSSAATASGSSRSAASLRWLEPGGGARPAYRLVDALLETGVEFSYAWKDVNVIPARTLPPRALVVAVTPLLDERSIGALVRPARPRATTSSSSRSRPSRTSSRAATASTWRALRLWRLQRTDLRGRFERLGVAVATLDDETTVEAALEGVRAFRRHARLVP